MPELPEVEVVRAGLAPAVVGARITAVDVIDERALTRHPAGAADFVSRLEGARVAAAARRGKFLWLPLEGDEQALMAHLGMSGQMLLRVPDAAPERHERVRLHVEHPAHGRLAVVFSDQRTFGSLAVDELIDTPDAAPGGFGTPLARIPTQAAHIARDPLDPAFDDAGFVAAVRRRSSAIKRLLLDQNLVSGIGNIYADEALWRARIHYDLPTTDLGPRKAVELLDASRTVMDEALRQGGTSFDSLYVNVNGESGYFSRGLEAYGREGEPCRRCGTAIVRRSFMNRSSYLCPRCQRAPKGRP